MRNAMKIWLIAAAFLVVIGLIMFVVAMFLCEWDFLKLSTSKYETNTRTVTEDFRNISVNTDTADITFALSGDGTCRVECYEDEKEKHSVTVQNDTLVIKTVNEKAWYDYIGINLRSPKLTVYLPETEYTSLSVRESTGDVEISGELQFLNMDISLSTGNVRVFASASNLMKIKTGTGSIRIENVSAGTLDISVSTGKTKLSNVTCENLTSNGSTGDVILDRVIAAERISIQRDTGDIKFDGADAAEIYVKTDAGDVTGTLLTEKVFVAKTDTGTIRVPNSTTGGRCEITTDTGDIKLDIQ